MLTHDEALRRLRDLQGDDGDREADHVRADLVLCELLNALGYADVVEEWKKVRKWYA